jgi:hypothetical protein
MCNRKQANRLRGGAITSSRLHSRRCLARFVPLVTALPLVKGDLSAEAVRRALTQVDHVELDGRTFGMRGRRLQFEFIRGESLNGERVFRD